MIVICENLRSFRKTFGKLLENFCYLKTGIIDKKKNAISVCLIKIFSVKFVGRIKMLHLH